MARRRDRHVVRLNRCKSDPPETRTFFWVTLEISVLRWKFLEAANGSFFRHTMEFFTLTLEKSWARPTTGRKRTNFGVTREFFRVSLESLATCPVPFSDLRWKLLKFLSYVGNHTILGDARPGISRRVRGSQERCDSSFFTIHIQRSATNVVHRQPSFALA